MKGAYIFKAMERQSWVGKNGGTQRGGRPEGTLPAVLNSTLYNDWGYSNQARNAKRLPAERRQDRPRRLGCTLATWHRSYRRSGVRQHQQQGPICRSCTPGQTYGLRHHGNQRHQRPVGLGFQANAPTRSGLRLLLVAGHGQRDRQRVNTQVIWKSAGRLPVRAQAATGAMIWSWTPPTSILARCHFCYLLDPLNRTEMSFPIPQPESPAHTLYPCTYAFESEGRSILPRLHLRRFHKRSQLVVLRPPNSTTTAHRLYRVNSSSRAAH